MARQVGGRQSPGRSEHYRVRDNKGEPTSETYQGPWLGRIKSPNVRLQSTSQSSRIGSYYDIGDAHLAAWSYHEAYPEVGRISNLVAFEPDLVSVYLDGTQLRLEPGQTVVSHGLDRELTAAEVLPARKRL